MSQEVRSVATYGRILNAIASGATKLNEISSKSGTSNSGMAYLLKLDDFKGQDFSIEMYH
ncbi:MAG TPA: hypothetical protein VLS94_04575 [Fusibacter sp.]|nr:hypothetical protein [Fusibacter sp.]